MTPPPPKSRSLTERWWASVRAVDRTTPRAKVDAKVTEGRRWVAAHRFSRLEVQPGFVSGALDDEAAFSPSLTIDPLADRSWERIVGVLARKLSWVTGLFEGRLPEDLVEALDASGVRLIPPPQQISKHSACECNDSVYPCAHLAALHHAFTAAFEADPLLLLAFRGRTRDRLLADLRAAWGGAQPGGESDPHGAAARAAIDPFTSPEPLGTVRFEFPPPETSCAGLRSLGPINGDAQLASSLEPLYAAGSAAALAIALGDSGEATPAPGRRILVRPAVPAPKAPQKPAASIDALLADSDPRLLGERVVDRLAEADDGMSVASIAEALGAAPDAIRKALREIQAVGMVAALGAGRGARWTLA